MIVVDHPDALIDQPISIVLRGFTPRQPVSVTATQTYAEATRWQSRATFISDNDGQVDVAQQAPVSGTYEGIAPMGLFWSMDRLPSDAGPAPPGAIMLPVPIRLEAEATDGRRAEITIVRRVAGPGVTRHVIRTDGLVGTLFLPPGIGPYPAVLVVSGGADGIEEFRGAILASHGYAALALGQFVVGGRPRGLVNIPLEYFETAISWMQRSRRSTIGCSRCGAPRAAASWHCCSVRRSRRSMPSRPGCRVECCSGRSALPSPAMRGHPYLEENNTSGDPPPVREPGRPVAYTPFYRSQLRDARAVERAAIPARRSAGRCSWSRASTIRCGHRPT